MASVAVPSVNHVALTVTHLDASIRWYERAFGIKYQMEEGHKGGVGKLLADEAWKLVIVLHRHDANDGEQFAETRTGLDHVGFALSSRAELDAWQAHLEEMGVQKADAAARPCTQSPIADTPYGSILVFRDPDNIQLELYAPPNS